MEKTKDKLKEIIFFTQKLPVPKQEEVLDYVKWIWLNVGKSKEDNLKQTVSKIREIQAKHQAGKEWDSVKTIRKWRESH